FLSHNNIVIDYATRTAIHKPSGLDLLNPKPAPKPIVPISSKIRFKQIMNACTTVLKELKESNEVCLRKNMPIKSPPSSAYIAAIRQWLEILSAQEKLRMLGEAVKSKYQDVFGEIPHVWDLPTDTYCHIKLKNPNLMITT